MKSLNAFVVAFLLSVTAAFGQTGTTEKSPYYGYEKVTIAGASWTVPDYINIETFPPLGGKLSERDARILGLHQEPLRESGWYVNELRQRHTFEVVWLEKGEMVWASGALGEPRYRVSCGNRISFLLAHQVTMTSPQIVPPAIPVLDEGAKSNKAISGLGTGYSAPGWLRSFRDGLVSMLLFLLGLALLVGILALLYLLGRALYDFIRNGGHRTPAPQPPAPTTPVVVPMPKGYRQVRQPTSATPEIPPAAPADPLFHRFGPFDHIMIDDAGEKGYRVTGVNDGQEFFLGTYRWAQSENAGSKGEYVVVLV